MSNNKFTETVIIQRQFIMTNINDCREIYDLLFPKLRNKEYDFVKNYLKTNNVESRAAVLLSVLTATLAYNELLEPERSDFYNRVKEKFIKDHGEKYAKDLLKGLEAYEG